MGKKLVACLLAMMVACLSVSALAQGYEWEGLWGAAGAYKTEVSGDEEQTGQSSETQKNNGGNKAKSGDVFAGDPLVFTHDQINRVLNVSYPDRIGFYLGPSFLYLVNAETNDAGEMTVTLRVASASPNQIVYHIRIDAEIGNGGLQRVVDHAQVTLPGVNEGLATEDLFFTVSNPSLEDTVLHVRIACPECYLDCEDIFPLRFVNASLEEKDVHLEAIAPGGYASPDQVIAEEKDFSFTVYWIEWEENGELEVYADIKHNFSADPDVCYAELAVNGEPLTNYMPSHDLGRGFGFVLNPSCFSDGKAPEKIESVSFRPVVCSDELENNPFVCDRVTYFLDVGGTEAHIPAWNGEDIEFAEPVVVLDYEGYRLSFTGIVRKEYDDDGDDEADNHVLILKGKVEKPFDDEICTCIHYEADGKKDNDNCYGDDFSLEFYDAETIPSEITLSLVIHRLVEWVDPEEIDAETLDAGLQLVASYTPEGETAVIVESAPLLKAGEIKLYIGK